MTFIESLMPHLLAAPILLPMAAAAVMLLLGDARRPLKSALNLLACVVNLLVAVALLLWVGQAGTQAVGVYLPGNWPAPYGIVLVADRLSAMMLLLTAVLGLAGVTYASGRWDSAGVHFHPLFQMQLLGLNGAFLTGDLFNLFVFFEIMLTASYGLLLHGGGPARVKAGLHYIAVNLLASTLFLIGVAVLYGVTGTLNLADMALVVPTIAPQDRGLLHAGAAILAIAFLVKAGAWPLNFWLAPAYGAAVAPVAALFAVMTKLGVYAVLRVWTLLFAPDSGVSAQFGGGALVWAGLATLAVGAIGVSGTRHLGRMVAACVVMSSGTVLTAIGFGRPDITAGALYYAVGSTLAVGAFFLIVELIDRSREVEETPLYVSEIEPAESFAYPVDLLPPPDVNLDDDQRPLIGQAIPAAMAFLGLAFAACAITVAGLPPLSGFVGKVVMLTGLLGAAQTQGQASQVAAPVWTLMALLIVTGLLTVIALSRAGMRYFWAPSGRPAPRLRVIETTPIALLLLLIGLLVWQADPALRYAQATARALHEPRGYISQVVSTRRLPPPPAAGGQERPQP
ncbi:MAG: monovalent cation/H+ antiporter subunit D [Desulfovibrionaceae bacterium]|jgi:multicomponent K+:H+ antiporter subunit D|nr:monovalent cation/H+ antiporter subunit D [Desulfovibrionaceae bacterium]